MINFREQQDKQIKLKDSYYQQLKQSTQFLRDSLEEFRPFLAVALGSGVNKLGESSDFEIVKKFSYQEIPNFPSPSVEGHSGNLIFVRYHNIPVVILQGRVHGYEVMDFPAGPVWGLKLATLPWRVIKGLGVEEVITTHACGAYAYNDFKVDVGDLGMIFDHTNLVGLTPLMGLNDKRLGKRFPSKGNLLNPLMLEEFTTELKQHQTHLTHYLTSLSMPNFEGLGDINVGLLKKMIRETNKKALGVFGMSMSFEADVINHFNDKPENEIGGFDRKVRYLPIGLITNIIGEQKIPQMKELINYQPNPASHEEVLAAQSKVQKTLLQGLTGYLEQLSSKSRYKDWEKRIKFGIAEEIV